MGGDRWVDAVQVKSSRSSDAYQMDVTMYGNRWIRCIMKCEMQNKGMWRVEAIKKRTI